MSLATRWPVGRLEERRIRSSCGRSEGLPIYPLDGGQILHSLLWFVMGRARSLMVATVLGLVGVVGLIVLALWMQSPWFGVMSFFILMNCWGGLQQARRLLRLARLPRHE